MEERGYWVPLNQKSDYQLYFKEADWIDQMFNLFESILLTEYGVLMPTTTPMVLLEIINFQEVLGFC